MTPDRFRFLLDAYGAGFENWPQAERESARALAAAAPELRAELVDAAQLDAWLDGHAVAEPDAALMQRVLAGAPGRPKRARWSGWSHWLLPGAGLAGIGLVGTLAGAMAVSIALRTMTPRLDGDWIERGSAFSRDLPYWRGE